MLERIVNAIGEYVDGSPQVKRAVASSADALIDVLGDKRYRNVLIHGAGIALLYYVAYKHGKSKAI